MKRVLVLICCCMAKHIAAQSFQPHTPLDNAQWITPASGNDSAGAPCPLFRKEFRIHSGVEKATLYITAHGVYEAGINGSRVGKDFFMPGCTAYDKRLLYQSYDVTELLVNRKRNRKRKSEMLITVGDGWYRGYYGNKGRKNNFGGDASLLCKLVISYTDGSADSIMSDGTWLCGRGPILRSDFYNGELVDNRISPGGWGAVKTGFTSQVNLQPYDIEPVREQERFVPERVFDSPAGETIVDFGQNMAGWVQLHARGHKGDTIRISHGEMLDKNGNFWMGNMTRANPVDVYVLAGKGTEILEPHFTYHGFRYIKIEGVIEGFQPDKNNCVAIALHSDLRHTGTFSCSNPLINQLQHNIEWSLNSNLIDIPTDCDNRAERLGWTGDAQIIFPTMAFNRDVHQFLKKWLEDLSLEQGSNGAIPRVIPDLYTPMEKGPKRGFAGWGDASVIIPMDIFETYGDSAILQRQYPSMIAWVKYEIGQTDPEDYVLKDWTYGDWLAMGPQTGYAFIDQCYLIHSIELLLKTRTILGISDHDGPMLEAALRNCKSAFQTAFICKDGLLSENTQTACAMALGFGLLPDSLQPLVTKQLVSLIHETDDHLATGFLGTAYIMQALTDHGQTALAYTLLLQETMPSWLYFVDQGATSMWEEWDAKKPNGDLRPCSFNLYAYGIVGNWLYSTVAGIRALSPGYQRIGIQPHPGGSLTWASASYESKYGKIVSSWKIVDGNFMLHAEVPPGVTAIITMPDGQSKEVGAGSYDFTCNLIITAKIKTQ